MNPPLHECFCCQSQLVYPLDWSEEGAQWRIVLRCPACESRREGIFERADVEYLDEELDRGTTILVNELRAVSRANMLEWGQTFTKALYADIITPDDFRERRI